MDTLERLEPVATLPAPPASDARVRRWLFIAAAAAFLLLQSGSITVSDGRAMYETTRAIVEERSLVVSPDVGVPGEPGYVSRYGLGLPLVSIVPYLLAKPVALVAGPARADLILQAAVASVMPLICAALVVALYGLGRRLGAGRRASVLCAVGGVVGTFALPYTKSFFSEPLAALGLVIAIERALAGRWRASAGGFVLAVLTRPQSLAFAPVYVFVALRRGGKRAAIDAAPVAALGALVMLLHNLARFGSPFAFGYADADGFTTPFLHGARELFTHPDKSVLLFAPVVLCAPFALARLRGSAALLLGGNFVCGFAIAAGWWSWAGGWSWGPRFLLPAVVPLVAAVAPWLESSRTRARVVVFAFVVGLVVSFPAMLVSPRAQQLDGEIVAPSVARQYELIAPTASYTAEHLRARGSGDARMYLDLWQVNVGGVLGGVGLGAAAVVSLGLFAVAFVGARRVARAV